VETGNAPSFHQLCNDKLILSFFVWESVLIRKILIYTKKTPTSTEENFCQNQGLVKLLQFESAVFTCAASGRSDACQRARG